MLTKERLFLSTIDPQAGTIARRYGLGLEIAEFCTAYNYDNCFRQTDDTIREELRGAPRAILHGPFNELFPCAIDPQARELAAKRFSQALELTERYGAEKLVLHGGFVPRLYFPCWYVEQSVLFWRSFLESHPGDYCIALENVLEDEPELLADIVRQVDDPRLRLCLDVGHVNAYSRIPVSRWLEIWEPYLTHTHIHNNSGSADTHSALDDGTLPIDTILRSIPDATVTLELPVIGNAVEWLTEKELLTL